MDDLCKNLKNKNWDIYTSIIPLLKSYIIVDLNGHISFEIIILKSQKEISNNYYISLMNMILHPEKKSVLLELPLFDKNINKCDILLGFLPNKNAPENISVKITPITKHLFCNNKSIELYIPIIKNKSFTPFLFDAFPYPRISFANYKVEFICNSLYPPTILCANFQEDERKKLYKPNVYYPVSNTFCQLLFPSITNIRKDPIIVLPNISNII